MVVMEWVAPEGQRLLFSVTRAGMVEEVDCKTAPTPVPVACLATALAVGWAVVVATMEIRALLVQSETPA